MIVYCYNYAVKGIFKGKKEGLLPAGHTGVWSSTVLR